MSFYIWRIWILAKVAGIWPFCAGFRQDSGYLCWIPTILPNPSQTSQDIQIRIRPGSRPSIFGQVEIIFQLTIILAPTKFWKMPKLFYAETNRTLETEKGFVWFSVHLLFAFYSRVKCLWY